MASKKLSESPYFRWMRGMSGLRYAPGHRDHGHREILIRGDQEAALAVDWGCVPDLEDPATLGCLLALVRERYKEPTLVPVFANGKWHLLGVQSETEALCLVGALL